MMDFCNTVTCNFSTLRKFQNIPNSNLTNGLYIPEGFNTSPKPFSLLGTGPRLGITKTTLIHNQNQDFNISHYCFNVWITVHL